AAAAQGAANGLGLALGEDADGPSERSVSPGGGNRPGGGAARQSRAGAGTHPRRLGQEERMRRCGGAGPVGCPPSGSDTRHAHARTAVPPLLHPRRASPDRRQIRDPFARTATGQDARYLPQEPDSGGHRSPAGTRQGVTRQALRGADMAKPAAPKAKATASNGTATAVLRRPAEQEYADELAALAAADQEERPDGWSLSPRAVRTYILGGQAGKTEIRPKYLGSERVVEIAIATLATDRALLLIGEPGTAKSWLSDCPIRGVQLHRMGYANPTLPQRPDRRPVGL